jgi:hypothetical protein
MKGLARTNTNVNYENPLTFQSKVMTKVGKEGQTQRVKVMVSNVGSCQKEYTCKI